MFTRNWYRMISAKLFYGYGNDYYTNVVGTQQYLRSHTYHTDLCVVRDEYKCPCLHKMRTSYSGYGGVVIGTGTQEPTLDDYELAGDVISSYTYSVSITKEFSDNIATVTALYTITNTGTKAFTIGEIGLQCDLGEDGTANNKALLERTILDSPLTVEPGGVGQLTYTIRFPYPTA